MRSSFRPLRHPFVFPTLRSAIAASNRRAPEHFRIVHFSVQVDHLHLLIEATDKHELSSGMRSLAIRIARRVNALVHRCGRVWADRWHAHTLASPRECRHALAYVLANFRKHEPANRALVDRYSSAPYFAGFSEYSSGPMGFTALVAGAGAVVLLPRTWLLRVGWRKSGTLSVRDGPCRTGMHEASS